MKPEDVERDLATPPPEKAGPDYVSIAEAASKAGISLARIRPVNDGILRNIAASYFWLRIGLAILAMALPVAVILWVGVDNLQTSISAYYHFNAAQPDEPGTAVTRDLFVGILWALGAFLFLYRGYSRLEDWALNVAGIAIIFVAMFPTDWPRLDDDAVRSTVGMIHFISAVTFFLAISFVCIFCARRTLEHLREDLRPHFARAYTLLGALMVGIPAVIFLIHQFRQPLERDYYVLWIEIAGIYVFAAFWLVKSLEIHIIRKPKRAAQGQPQAATAT